MSNKLVKSVQKTGKVLALSAAALAATVTASQATMLLHAISNDGQSCKKYEVGIGTGRNVYRFGGKNVRASVKFVNNGQRLIQNFTNALKPVAKEVLKSPNVGAVVVTGYGNRASSVTHRKTAKPVIVGKKNIAVSFNLNKCKKVRSKSANDGNKYVPKFGKDVGHFVRALN